MTTGLVIKFRATELKLLCLNDRETLVKQEIDRKVFMY